MRQIEGKRVLVIGNGDSEKELALLSFKPALLIYSDLSSAAVQATFGRYDLSGYSPLLLGAAIDALDLPVPDESVDVVYGYAIVHHLPHIQLFLREVHRVLKPNGWCVFADDGLAPMWHLCKRTILRALMRHSHRKSGISPEDYRFSMSGGFRQHDLEKTMLALGCNPFFERASLLTYMWHRGVTKLLPRRLHRTLTPGGLGRCLAATDRALSNICIFRANLIRLVWGFEKS
jgi:ubiquinone/menaquinone biosynthesis C-methylase UbiE